MHDEREPGAERPDSTGSEGAEPSSMTPQEPRDEASDDSRQGPPAAAEAWPSQPGGDATRAAVWGSSPADQTAPPSEVEAYPAAAPPQPDAHEGAVTAAHSVPSGEGVVGESTQCPRCGTENRPGLAFCRSCGQRLMAAGVSTTVDRPGAPDGSMACPRCGTHNRAGVGFCQNCGANLRGVGAGYVPPAAPGVESEARVEGRRGAVLGPLVLLVGLAGLVTAYLLTFAYGSGSLWERASSADGYGAAFWNGYPTGVGFADQAYFGLAAPAPLLGVLLLALAVGGFIRATPGPLQTVGLAVAALWSVALAVLFVLVEILGSWGGDLVALLSALTPAGIIFFLASLIIIIGTLTRFGRS
jgi:hypothetical protein